MSICLNIDYDNGTTELFLNGERLPLKVKKPMELPSEVEQNPPLVVRLGQYYFDNTPLIGKVWHAGT